MKKLSILLAVVMISGLVAMAETSVPAATTPAKASIVKTVKARIARKVRKEKKTAVVTPAAPITEKK